jgi:hypothetical protein
MKESSPATASFRDYFSKILANAGFETRPWQLVPDVEPIVLAENPYYVIAFQVFDLWNDLIKTAGRIELALSELIDKSTGTGKTWDAYLVLVCRSEIHDVDEFNQFSDLAYNTRHTRKIIRAGLGDSVTSLDEVTRPFVSLTKARSSAKGRDPLQLLENKMIENGYDSSEIQRLIIAFKERGDLAGI